MLRSLEIRDMLIIDHLSLEFRPGLNALTGETGAGKSILLDSLGFVLGWRGRAELVREGAEQGEVTAVFDLPSGHAAADVLVEAGIDAEDGELILRRVNTRDGRKTAWVNDRRVSGEVLRQLSDLLVELHGQQDDRGLLNPRNHRSMLDDFADCGDLAAATSDAWKALKSKEKDLAAAEARLDALRAEEEFLRHAVGELSKLAPEAGEEEALNAKRRLMRASAKIGEDIRRAGEALGRDGAEGPLSDALRWLEGAAEAAEGRLDGALAALGRVFDELGEAQSGVEACLDVLDFDPAELERTEERLFAIRALARKHGVAPDELGTLTEELAARLTKLDRGSDEIGGLERAVDAARREFDKAANALSAARQKAAASLDKAMGIELPPLKMEAAAFTTRISATEPGPGGVDEVVFEASTNPGAPAGPINKIASGGELSRFLLALKVCLTRGDTGLTMIFDEIDRGVGGATADAVGRRLARLAGEAQVLVVTHSPQVAARAAHQWQVAKSVMAGQTLSRVSALDDDARVDEIARMLAGDTITDEARQAARALLAG